MVDQQWQTHKEEIEYRRERRQKDVDALRRALKEEISTIGYLDRLATEYSIGHSRLETLVPKYIYEANGTQLGMLTEQEVNLVVEYYTRAFEVENLRQVQKEEDTTAGVNRVMEIFFISERITDSVAKLLTFGTYTPNSEKRADTIRDRLQRLADAQEKAISELDNHIREDS